MGRSRESGDTGYWALRCGSCWLSFPSSSSSIHLTFPAALTSSIKPSPSSSLPPPPYHSFAISQSPPHTHTAIIVPTLIVHLFQIHPRNHDCHAYRALTPSLPPAPSPPPSPPQPRPPQELPAPLRHHRAPEGQKVPHETLHGSPG